MRMDNSRDAVESDGYNEQRHGKEHNELHFSLDGHLAHYNDRHRKANQEKVCQNIANASSDQIDIALAALSAWVRKDLPMVGERVAFSQVADDNRDEGGDQNTANDPYAVLIGL